MYPSWRWDEKENALKDLATFNNAFSFWFRYVELPDGRIQRVRYTVNKYSGFVAEVTYEGQATTTPPPKYAPRQLPYNYNRGYTF